MARIKMQARINLPHRCACDRGLKNYLGETDQPCATEIVHRAQMIDSDAFTSNDRRALPFAVERIQSLLKQFGGGHQNMDSDIAVLLRAAKHILQTSVDESSTVVISPSSSTCLPASAAAVSSSSSSPLSFLRPAVSTPTERSLARVASLVAVGEESGCGSAMDRAHLASHRRELTSMEKFIVPQLQPTDELDKEEFECAKKQLVVLEQMNTTQTVPRLHLALAQLFGEPNQYSIIGAVFRVTRHIAIQEERKEQVKQLKQAARWNRTRVASASAAAASSSSAVAPLNYPHTRDNQRKACNSMKADEEADEEQDKEGDEHSEQPPAKRLRSNA